MFKQLKKTLVESYVGAKAPGKRDTCSGPRGLLAHQRFLVNLRDDL